MTLTKISHLATARFDGPEAGAFLQAQLSADVLALEPGGATFACYCTPRGQVLGLLLVCRLESGFLVAGGAEVLPGILQRLRMFVLRTRVEFSLQEHLTVCGADEDVEPVPGLQLFRPEKAGLVYGFSEAERTFNGNPSQWKAAELKAGIVWLEAATVEKFIPQMLGFDRIGAVSFSKGCYPGQEIVARTRYLGRVKRTPLLVATHDSFEAAHGEQLRIRLNGDWNKASLIDSVETENGGSRLFLVTRADENAEADEIEYAGRNYRCATT